MMCAGPMKNLVRFTTLFWMLICLPAWPTEPSEDARANLRRAERDLAVSRAAARRVEERLEALKENPAATPEQIEAMEAYAVEIRALVRVREQTLEDLRTMAGEPLDAPGPEVLEGMAVFGEAVAGVPDAKDPETEPERLDREFEASLEAFDAAILEHERKLEDWMAVRISKGEKEAAGHQSAAAEAEELLRAMGVDPGTGGAEAAGSETAEAGDATGEAGEETAGRTAAASGETAGAEEPGGKAKGGEAGDRPPREDEDIVARQLREAAEKETDPVLREKLWKEYEAYLDGRS